jgi:hypothetical protein
VLSDVHGNPWALRAALEDVRRVSVDLVVNCGDLVAGPWPTEVVEELLGCGLPVLSVRGNGDRMVADASDGRWDDVPPPARPTVAWAAARPRPEERRLVGAMPLTAEVDVQGLGAVACFHATPGSDEEILLPTSEEDACASCSRRFCPTLRSTGTATSKTIGSSRADAWSTPGVSASPSTAAARRGCCSAPG